MVFGPFWERFGGIGPFWERFWSVLGEGGQEGFLSVFQVSLVSQSLAGPGHHIPPVYPPMSFPPNPIRIRKGGKVRPGGGMPIGSDGGGGPMGEEVRWGGGPMGGGPMGGGEQTRKGCRAELQWHSPTRIAAELQMPFEDSPDFPRSAVQSLLRLS